MANLNQEHIEIMKDRLRKKLLATGVSTVIQHTVRDMFTEQEDLNLDGDPEHIVKNLYKRGLLKKVLATVRLQNDKQEDTHKAFPNLYCGMGPSDEFLETELSPPRKELSEQLLHDQTITVPLEPVQGIESESDRRSEQAMSKGSDGKPEKNTGLKKICKPGKDVVRKPRAGKVKDHNIHQHLRNKCILHFEVIGGKGFLDWAANKDSENLQTFIHLSYGSQRFLSAPTEYCEEPTVQLSAMIELCDLSNGSANQLLKKGALVEILLILQDGQENRILLSACHYDWRCILSSEKTTEKAYIPLMGVGKESKTNVGTLVAMLAIVPNLRETLSTWTYNEQVELERSVCEEKEKLFLSYVKQWWKDYIQIRPDHVKRQVKIFSYDENSSPKPVQSFVCPISCDRHLLTPFHAAWFVSLISVLKPSDDPGKVLHISHGGGPGLPSVQVFCDHWQSLLCTLTTKAGRVEDHANLLCSLLLGFGLDAYVGIGTIADGRPWVWVVTLDHQDQATFWESTTGLRYFHQPETDENVAVTATKPSYPYTTISTLYNHTSFYANTQSSVSLGLTSWDLNSSDKWKSIPKSTLKVSSGLQEKSVKLLPSSISVSLLAVEIEVQLRSLIAEVRLKHNLRTRWNSFLAVVCGQELAKYELEACNDCLEMPSCFNSIMLRRLQNGYEFKGFPWNGTSQTAKVLFSHLMRRPKCIEVMLHNGKNVQHAVRVQVFSYPDDVVSTRVLVCCQFHPDESGLT